MLEYFEDLDDLRGREDMIDEKEDDRREAQSIPRHLR